MKNKNQKLVPIILVSLSCLLFIVAIVLVLNMNHFEFSNKTQNKDNNQSQVKEDNNEVNIESSVDASNDTQNNGNVNQDINTDLNDNSKTENNDAVSSSDTEVNNDVVTFNKQESKEEVIPSPNENELISKNEVNVISYFESQDNMITETTNQDDVTLREKAKNAFITAVDFIFYDKEIKGYTFKELTTATKLKIIKLGLSIDHKIDEYFPDYKDVIKDKYDNIKGKLAVKYLEFTSKLCETVGEDTCNQAKEDFNTMKKSFSITWQLIKELASTGSSKVKEFYESWRDSE